MNELYMVAETHLMTRGYTFPLMETEKLVCVPVL